MNLSLNTYRHWIARNVYPDASQSVMLSNILHTSVEYLVTGNDTRPKPDVSQALKAIDEARRAVENL